VETIRQVCAEVDDTVRTWVTRPDGTTIRPTCIVIDILMPDNELRGFALCGITENREPVEQTFLEGIDAYPPEVASLVSALDQRSRRGRRTGSQRPARELTRATTAAKGDDHALVHTETATPIPSVAAGGA
jgi:hypothetical protein